MFLRSIDGLGGLAPLVRLRDDCLAAMLSVRSRSMSDPDGLLCTGALMVAPWFRVNVIHYVCTGPPDKQPRPRVFALSR